MAMERTVGPALPLDEASRQALLEGTKLSATWLRQYGGEGARFAVGGEVFEITGIAEFPLGYVADAYYRVEGFDSPEEFAAAWARLYPRLGFRPAQPVNFHTFRKVERYVEDDSYPPERLPPHPVTRMGGGDAEGEQPTLTPSPSPSRLASAGPA